MTSSTLPGSGDASVPTPLSRGEEANPTIHPHTPHAHHPPTHSARPHTLTNKNKNRGNPIFYVVLAREVLMER